MPPTKAKWSIRPSDLNAKTSEDGTVTLTAPLRDGTSLVGTLSFTMTSDRALRVQWSAEPGAEPLTGFSAWQTGS